MKKKKAIASLVAVSVVATTLATAQPVITQAATNLKVSVSKCTLQVGKKMAVSANQKVTWKSSNKKVATVKKVNGKKAKITAKKKGTCKVTATAGKKKAVIKVTVKKAQVQSVAPTVASDNISNETSSNTQVYMNETCGVSICLSDVKTTEGTIVIENNSGTDVTFGLDYSIEKYENGQWTKLTSNPVAIPDIAMIVFNGCSYTSNLSWAGMYGSLAQGTYRVVKQVSVSGQGDKEIASQFVIDEKTEIGATNTPTSSGQADGATAKPTVVVPPRTADPAYSGPIYTLSPEEKEKLEHAIPSDNMPVISENPTMSQETSQLDTQVYMDETCGVSISLSDVKTTGGTITIANNSGNEVIFGQEYFIEKYEDDQWKTLRSNPIVIPALAIGLFNEKTYTNTISWAGMYGSLPQGTYRVVKQVSVYGKEIKKIASQFMIDEDTEVGVTNEPTVTEQPGVPTATPAVVTLP